MYVVLSVLLCSRRRRRHRLRPNRMGRSAAYKKKIGIFLVNPLDELEYVRLSVTTVREHDGVRGKRS